MQTEEWPSRLVKTARECNSSIGLLLSSEKRPQPTETTMEGGARAAETSPKDDVLTFSRDEHAKKEEDRGIVSFKVRRENKREKKL